MTPPSRYKSLKKAFDGGMSLAKLYHDDHLDRNVIIKELLPGADQKRLLDELQALSSIRSRHVVELYDVVRSSSGEIEAIVVEYLPGKDLNSRIGKVDAAETLRIGMALSIGISDIHGHGQIHRDIKLNNIKFDSEGCLKIFDFGLSPKDADAVTKGLIGTFGYIAPELCVEADDNVSFTQAVDIFAFASVILKLMRGSLPKSIRKIPPELPCAEADFYNQSIALPKDICELLNRCHSIDATMRPHIDEIRAAFSAHILYNQHRATLVIGQNVHSLHVGNPIVNITAGPMGQFTIAYDGMAFHITATTGSIYVNNSPVMLPHALPGSCVVTMGPPSAGMNRVYVPVDVSHPEVIV